MTTEEYGQTDVEEWKWPCGIVEVVDGDTIGVVIDRGFNDRTVKRIRLYGVDTAEIYGVEKESWEYEVGMEQKRLVERWLDVETEEKFPFTLHTFEREGKFGRWLGDISYNGNMLSHAILEEWPDYHY